MNGSDYPGMMMPGPSSSIPYAAQTQPQVPSTILRRNQLQFPNNLNITVHVSDEARYTIRRYAIVSAVLGFVALIISLVGLYYILHKPFATPIVNVPVQ